MQPTRRARLQSVILEELSTLVQREIKDPRVQGLIFTQVEVTPDGGQATIRVALFGNPDPESPEATKKLQEAIRGLESASGFIRRHLAQALTIRQVPALSFKEDRGFSNSLRVHELLKQIHQK